MKIKMVGLSILAVVVATALSGCNTVSEFVTGMPMPNTNHPHVSNGVYTGPVGTQANLANFSVNIPQAQEPNEYPYMQMKENYAPDGSGVYVSFGPADMDFTIYRVMIMFNSPNSCADAAYNVIAETAQQAYQEPTTKLLQKQTMLQQWPATYVVLTQTIPPYTNARLQQVSGKVLTHAAYCINEGNYFVVLWTMGDSSGAINAVTDGNRSELLDGTWPPEVAFVNSFHLVPAGDMQSSS